MRATPRPREMPRDSNHHHHQHQQHHHLEGELLTQLSPASKTSAPCRECGGRTCPPGCPGCRDTPRRQRQKHKKWRDGQVRGSLSGCILCTGCLERKSWLGIPVALRLRARREVPADSYALPKTTPPVGGVDGVPRGARRRALICYMPLAFELFGSSLFATWGMPTTSEPTRTTRCVRLGRRFWTER